MNFAYLQTVAIDMQDLFLLACMMPETRKRQGSAFFGFVSPF